jgi:hypothetical protein
VPLERSVCLNISSFSRMAPGLFNKRCFSEVYGYDSSIGKIVTILANKI